MNEPQPVDRAAIANEVWNEAGAQVAAPEHNADEVIVEEIPQDQKVIDPLDDMRGQLSALSAKVGYLDEIEARVKQAERRLGGVLNDLNAAKESAKTMENAPTKEQIDQAAGNKAEWDSLQEDFPEWTKATEHKLAAERTEFERQLASIRQEMKSLQQGNHGEEIEILKEEMAGNIVSMRHPDWKKINQTDEFFNWWEEQQSAGRQNSFDPSAVAAVFDDFAKYQSTRKTAAQITGERQKLLQQHETKPGHKLPSVKSEADMNPSELRAHVAAKVWL